MLKRPTLPVLLASSFLAPALTAQEADPRIEWLTGDYALGGWDGKRGELSDKGFDFTLEYILDSVYAPRGAIQDKHYNSLGELDLGLTIDTAKAGWWEGGVFNIFGYWAHGGDPSGDAIGDLQLVASIEDIEINEIAELWYQHSFDDGRWVAKFGIIDLLSDFGTADAEGFYSNFSSVYSPVANAAGQISAPPISTLAASVMFAPNDDWVFRLAIQDGIPTDLQEDRSGFEIKLRSDDGIAIIAEAARMLGNDHWSLTAKAGFWYNSGKFTDLRTGLQDDGNWGLYGILDAAFNKQVNGRQWQAFLRADISPTDLSIYETFIAGGVSRTGTFSGRDSDVYGVAFWALKANGEIPNSSTEVTMETAYTLSMTNFWTFRVSYQHILNTGATKGTNNADAIVFRTHIIF